MNKKNTRNTTHIIINIVMEEAALNGWLELIVLIIRPPIAYNKLASDKWKMWGKGDYEVPVIEMLSFLFNLLDGMDNFLCVFVVIILMRT